MELNPSVKAKHFLVVDDYESMRVLISDHLKQLGVTKITVANSGNEAVAKFKQLESSDPIGFILTDLMMEDGNGIELARQIRQTLGKKIPVIMITSKSEVSYVLEAIQAGVTSYLIKPWQLTDLAKKINEADAKK
ncbi:MAG: response regulator [Bacteriovoracaceae bacterium]